MTRQDMIEDVKTTLALAISIVGPRDLIGLLLGYVVVGCRTTGIPLDQLHQQIDAIWHTAQVQKGDV